MRTAFRLGIAEAANQAVISPWGALLALALLVAADAVSRLRPPA